MLALRLDDISDSDEMVISAAWGLGEAVVAGHVQADEFVVAKRDEAVQSTTIGDKHHRVLSEAGISRLVETDARERAAPSLSAVQLAELAALLLRIEQHYGAPQDIEWCHDGGRFWIVQARPVTIAPPRKKRDVQWTRANAREVLPDLPSPQALEAICDIVPGQSSDGWRARCPRSVRWTRASSRFVERGWIDARDDYFFLLLPEVEAAIRNPTAAVALCEVVTRRKSEIAA